MSWLPSRLWSRFNLITRLSLVVTLSILLVAIGTVYQSTQYIIHRTQDNLIVEYNQQLDTLESVVTLVSFVAGKSSHNFDVERLTDVLTNFKYSADVTQISFRDTSDGSVFSHDITIQLVAPLFFAHWCGLETINVNRPIIFEGLYYGLLSLSMSPNRIINRGWDRYLYLVRALLFSLALVLFSIWFVLRKALHPLLSLAKASKTLTQGDLSVRVEIAGSPELRTVLANFNRMAASIQSTLEALLISEARFKHLFNQAPIPLCSVNNDGRLLDINTRFIKIFGYSLTDVPNLTAWWQCACPDPLYRKWVLETWNNAVVHADGSGSDIEPLEYQVTCKDGTVRTMLISGIILGQDLLATFFDVTERRQAEGEVRQLNAELEKRVEQRTAELSAANLELDSFAYAVSHDLRAPLRAMSGFSQALIEDFDNQLEDKARQYLEQITLASHRMSKLIDGILALSRSTRGEMQHDMVNLSDLTHRLLSELARTEPERRVSVLVEPGLKAEGDARMLEAALRNLLGNAWKYSAHTKEATIRVYSEKRDGVRWFCVADNGAGFDMAHTTRLFQPFQRLHRQDEFPGLGIGLATVQRIIHRHGGRIEANGEPGHGATFRFTLPGDQYLPEEYPS